MNLSFQTKINDRPTWFVEKIWHGLGFIQDPKPLELAPYITETAERFPDVISKEAKVPLPKIHTIRKDRANRWEPGKKIHFLINNRTPNRFQFAPVVLVKRVQSIQIIYKDPEEVFPVIIIGPTEETFGVILNPKADFYEDIVLNLAQNDGFDSLEDFFAYFSEDFTGKLIHWTDFSYTVDLIA